MKNVYIYYSGATDKTGKALQEALDIEGGNKKPAGKTDVIIGWGAKTKDDVTFTAGTKVLNHPNYIRANRNKLHSLTAMKNAGVAVADFIAAGQVVGAVNSPDNPIKLPLVGRTKFHQGGKGFWLCVTMSQLQQAIKEGAEYFQNYINIVDEWRLHIFQGALIYAQKKVQRDPKDMGNAFVEQYGDKVKALAEKKGEKIDESTMKNVLEAMAERVQPTPDMIIRSNTRGWKFSNVKLTNVNKALLDEAVKALAAIKLDFGAVDCCTTADGGVSIIEVNSGPGLQGTPFDIYTATFKEAIKNLLAPPTVKVAETKVKMDSSASLKKGVTATKKGSVKERLQAQAALLAEMADEADEAEAEVLSSIWARLASKK